ncbi:MAG: hypothetical protein BZY82_04575 [SAR202 cluster bacterium Io17-Chloro-G3]|nr:MAG: hypothetical protein BZY82_04575 [SAR202 cluster bacterium Io17-Chloro-G3]
MTSKMTVDDLKELVALSNRTLHHVGLVTTSGHASHRIPGTDRVLIKRNGVLQRSIAITETVDILTMDLEGNHLDGEGTLPVEWPLHTEIYKARADVMGVVHTHQKWASAFGVAGVRIRPVLHPGLASSAVLPIPIYDESYDIVRTVQQGKVAAEVFGQSIACHLRNHGMVFGAASLEAAVVAAINLEYQAQVTWHAMQLAPSEEIQEIPMLFMRNMVEQRREGRVGNTWNYYKWLDKNIHSARLRQVQQ